MAIPNVPIARPFADNPTDYVWDVFLSYTRKKPFGPWVAKTFYEDFENWLRQALGGREPKIHFDDSAVVSGDAWPHRIRLGLATSRCLVAVWSPDYFNSTWCVRECCMMLQREEHLGYRSSLNPRGLILPIQVYDRERFPEAVRKLVSETQSLDCRDYANDAPMFKQTMRYYEFIELMKTWTKEVAEVVRTAPPWRQEWLTPEWLETRPLVCEDKLRPPEPHFPAPSLA